MRRTNEIILIMLLILAACTPIIYMTLTKFSEWIYGLTVAWTLLAVVYVSIAALKWK